MQETQVWSLSWEDPLEKEITTHSSILAWKNSMDRGVWQAAVHEATISRTQLFVQFNSISLVQVFRHVWLFTTPWTVAHQTSLSITNSWNLLRLMFIESVMPPNHLILCCALLPLPSVFPSIRIFSDESALCIRWTKYCSFSFSICPFNEYPGLISFRTDWFDICAVQGTFKSILHSSKASILQRSVFFMVQLLHPCTRLLEKS